MIYFRKNFSPTIIVDTRLKNIQITIPIIYQNMSNYRQICHIRNTMISKSSCLEYILLSKLTFLE